MKKFLLGMTMLLAAGSSFAQPIAGESVTITADKSEVTLPCTDGTDTIRISFTYAGPDERLEFYNALQVTFLMPEGVEPVPDWYEVKKKGKIYEYIPHNIKQFESLEAFSSGDNFVPIGSDDNNTGLNEYRLLFFIVGEDKLIWDNEETMFEIAVRVGEKTKSGPITITASSIKFTYPVEVPDPDNPGKTVWSQQPVTFPDASLTVDVDVTHEIGESGYSTLCWPTALDFSDNTFDANIGVAVEGNTFMALNSVKKVPAGTPVVIKGDPGVYHLKTTTDENTEDVSANILSGTPNAPLTVTEGANIFALAKKTEGIGFYRCLTDVVIPQFKAYYTTDDASATAFLFEESTGVSQVNTEVTESNIYTISGVKVEKAAQKGVYIVDGKKVVVK